MSHPNCFSQEVYGLNQLFRVGQLVRCKIIDEKPGKLGKWKPKLTINPTEVNQNLTASNVKPDVVSTKTSVVDFESPQI